MLATGTTPAADQAAQPFAHHVARNLLAQPYLGLTRFSASMHALLFAPQGLPAPARLPPCVMKEP
jgi:hypothetical protein